MGEPLKTGEGYDDGQDDAPNLELIDNERFRTCDDFLRKNANTFFVASRLSEGYRMQFGVFLRAIRLIKPLSSDEKALYVPWLALSPEKQAALGHSRQIVEDTVVEQLAARNDPAVHVINTLEYLRKTNMPEIEQEPRRLDDAFAAYNLLLSSVHGSPETE